MMKKSSISSGSYAVLTRPDVVIDAIRLFVPERGVSVGPIAGVSVG